MALARAQGRKQSIKGSENPSSDAAATTTSAIVGVSSLVSPVKRWWWCESQRGGQMTRGRAAGGRVMGPLMSVVCVRWWSEVWRYDGDPHMNFKSKMRRNLKVILLMAIVWAGGLLYLAKNGDKPLKQVSQIQVLQKSFQVKNLFWFKIGEILVPKRSLKFLVLFSKMKIRVPVFFCTLLKCWSRSKAHQKMIGNDETSSWNAVLLRYH